MTPDRWTSIKEHCKMAKAEGANLHWTMVADCIAEIEQLKKACRMAYQGLCTYDDEAAQDAIAFIDTLETDPCST